jgi:tetratricopeptide (TPR) repeat protein
LKQLSKDPKVNRRFCKDVRFRPLLLIGLFILIPATTSFGYSQLQHKQALPQSAEDWLKLGIELWRTSTESQNNSREAIAAFTEAIRLQPDYEAAYLQLATVLGASGKHEEQLAVLFSAREIIPASMDVMRAVAERLLIEERYADLAAISGVYLSLQPLDNMMRNDYGWALMKLGRYEEAATELEKTVAIDGTFAIALNNLAATYENLGRPNEALILYERILDVDPNYRKWNAVWQWRIKLLVKLNRVSDALDAIEKELKRDPKSAIAYYGRGYISLNQSNPDDAILNFKRAEEVGCPYDLKAELYMELGRTYLQMSRNLDAIEALEKSAQVKQDSFETQALLALAYERAALCEKAMEPFQKAISLKPEEMGIYNNLSVCLIKFDRLDDAEKGLRYSIQLDPGNVVPRLNLSSLLMMQEKFNEAESELRRIVGMNIADWKAFFMLANILLQRKNLSEAVIYYRQALRLRPEEPMILNNLGNTLLVLNEKLDEAFNLIERAVKASPYNAMFRDSLGWAYFKLGKLNEADRELTEVVQKDPKNAVSFERLGDVKEKLGKTGDARICWEHALSLTTDEEMKNRLQAKLDSR